MDREDSVRKKCMDVVHSMLLAPLENPSEDAAAAALSWRFLEAINNEPEAL